LPCFDQRPKLALDGSASVGVAAHMTAAAAQGPRFDSALEAQERAAIENGIWLCQSCAKLIDNDEVRFTVVLLRDWKRVAEAEALAHLGKPVAQSASVAILESVHGRLERESNPRFGFSFMYPTVWDRQDPDNGDGNTYRHPQNAQIELRVWGAYAVLAPDLDAWVEHTIGYLQAEAGFCLLTKVPSELHLVDWKHHGWNGAIVETRQQVEGYRMVHQAYQDCQPFTVMQTFAQVGDTQITQRCQAPAAIYGRYEELFLVTSKELRMLGVNAAPFARTGRIHGTGFSSAWPRFTSWFRRA
jgi:hypothetical protein